MLLRYLLDTNVVSDLVRHPQGRVAARVAAVGEPAVCTSIVVGAALRYGAEKSGSARLRERIQLVLSAMEVRSLEAPADRHYGRIRQQLAAQNTPVGPNDLLIAAHALTADVAVVTANEAEFRRVPGLRVENRLAG